MTDTMRTPPHSDDAEEAVLSAMLGWPAAIPVAAKILTPEMFYAEKRRRLFRVMADLSQRGVEVDPITLSEALAARHELEASGGKDYIGYLIDVVPTGENVRHHAQIVADHAEKRRVLEALMQAQSAIYANEAPVADIAGQVQGALSKAVTRDGSVGFRALDHAAWYAFMETLEERGRLTSAGKLAGLPTGYPALDRHILGLRTGELVIPAARPKCGKTAFSLNVALNVALMDPDAVGPVGIVSTEMTRMEVQEGLIAAMTQVERRRLSTGALYGDELTAITRAALQLNDRLHVDDEAFPTLEDVIARSLDLKARVPNLSLLVVDYLQRITKRLKGRRGDEELAAITSAMKGLAKTLGIPLIAPAQVNFKDTDKREQKRPMLADIQGGSSFAQDANFVLILHRPGLFDPSPHLERVFEVDCQASRRTENFTESLEWDGSRMRITNGTREPVR